MKRPDLAKKFRVNLIKNGINTKILPEAMTWHFAKYWKHMKELSTSHKKTNFILLFQNLKNC